MDKREEIPQWAWDAAGEVMRSSPFAMEASDYFDETADLIARALIKAREEAFEEAAKLAEAHAAEASMSQKAAFDRGNDVAGNMFWSGQTAALAISQAIREAVAGRPCTCHPDDNPPNPCAKKYAFTECASAIRQHSQKGGEK